MDLTKNANRFSGKDSVNQYDRFRPSPPPALIDLAKQYLDDSIHHMVDIGCGSGLSTLAWKDEVNQITAVDPSEDMLNACKKKFAEIKSFEAIQAFGHAMPLAAECADLITCSQSFHWMDPLPTLAEIGRVLKRQGLLVIYDCVWPPSVYPLWERAFIELFDGILEISERQPQPLMHFWSKNEHLNNVKKTELFSYVKQVGFDQVVSGDGDYFIGLAESQGGLQALRKIGMTDDEIGWTKFKQIINSNPLSLNTNFTLHYSAIFAIK